MVNVILPQAAFLETPHLRPHWARLAEVIATTLANKDISLAFAGLARPLPIELAFIALRYRFWATTAAFSDLAAEFLSQDYGLDSKAADVLVRAVTDYLRLYYSAPGHCDTEAHEQDFFLEILVASLGAAEFEQPVGYLGFGPGLLQLLAKALEPAASESQIVFHSDLQRTIVDAGTDLQLRLQETPWYLDLIRLRSHLMVSTNSLSSSMIAVEECTSCFELLALIGGRSVLSQHELARYERAIALCETAGLSYRDTPGGRRSGYRLSHSGQRIVAHFCALDRITAADKIKNWTGLPEIIQQKWLSICPDETLLGIDQLPQAACKISVGSLRVLVRRLAKLKSENLSTLLQELPAANLDAFKRRELCKVLADFAPNPDIDNFLLSESQCSASPQLRQAARLSLKKREQKEAEL